MPSFGSHSARPGGSASSVSIRPSYSGNALVSPDSGPSTFS